MRGEGLALVHTRAGLALPRPGVRRETCRVAALRPDMLPKCGDEGIDDLCCAA